MIRPRISTALFPLAVVGAAAASASCYLRARRRISFHGKTVLISGASRGLGLELARRFAREGAHVVLLARARDELRNAASEFLDRGVDATVLECDVRKPDEVKKTVGEVIERRGAIDVLVNNAGIIQVGPMERRGTGRIVNIASIGGKVAVPHLLPYVASKFALVGLSEGLRPELAKDGIYVTTVCPGLMRTGSHLNALFKGDHEKEFALFSIANALPLLSTSSEKAARQIVEACRDGRAEIFITPQARLLDIVNCLFPGLVAESLALVNRALPGARDRSGDILKRGWESRSRLAPSFLTRRADRAAARNQEHPPPAAGS